MAHCQYTTLAPQAATEPMDAIVRNAVLHDTHATLQLSCRCGLAVVSLPPEQLFQFMADAGVQHHNELRGQKVVAHMDAAKVVGIGAR